MSMMAKHILLIFSFVTLSTTVQAMKLSLEQREAGINWWKARKEAERTWEVFQKIPEGKRFAEIDTLKEEQPHLSELPLLKGKAIDDAWKTKEFIDFYDAQSSEIVWRKRIALLENQETKKRELAGSVGLTREFDQNCGTLPITIEYAHSEKHDVTKKESQNHEISPITTEYYHSEKDESLSVHERIVNELKEELISVSMYDYSNDIDVD
jgi:hypothetical protein